MDFTDEEIDAIAREAWPEEYALVARYHESVPAQAHENLLRKPRETTRIILEAAAARLTRRSARKYAWDEAIEETYACGHIHEFARDEMIKRNPYRES